MIFNKMLQNKKKAILEILQIKFQRKVKAIYHNLKNEKNYKWRK